MKKQNKKAKTDKGRRKFLKLLAFGGVALFAAKIFGGKVAALAAPVSAKSGDKKIGNRVSSDQMDVVENEDNVVFLDKKTKEEILILEKN